MDYITTERIHNLYQKEINVSFNGFSYIVKCKDEIVIFLNTDVPAVSYHVTDEAVILSSDTTNQTLFDLHSHILKGTVTGIYSVSTVLTFSRNGHISLITRLRELYNRMHSKMSRKVYKAFFPESLLFHKRQYRNPNSVCLELITPMNFVVCGYLLEIDNTTCFPLFAQENSLFFVFYRKQKTSRFIEKWKDKYSFVEDNENIFVNR
jgi:hypothetical protein